MNTFSKKLATYCLITVLSIFSLSTTMAQGPEDKSSANAVSREELRQAMYKAFLSKGPAADKAVKPKMEVLKKTKEEGHERWHIRYLVDKNEYSYAFLLIPQNLSKGSKLPLVLCPHGTSDIGKERVVAIYHEPATTAKEKTLRKNRKYAIDLVRRGFIVFAPDRAAFGERHLETEGGWKTQMPAYQKFISKSYPGWTLNGKAIWDLQRALDFLVDLEFVDKENIGIIGHSLGAWDSIFLTGLDERIKVSVMSSGGMMIYKPELWTDPAVLKNYLTESGKKSIGENANILLMLAANRSVLYLYSLDDYLYKKKPQLLDGFKVVYDYYKKSHADKKADLGFYLQPDGHDFTEPTQQLAYQWLESRLKKTTK